MRKQENARAFKGHVEKCAYFKDRCRGHQVRTKTGLYGAGTNRTTDIPVLRLRSQQKALLSLLLNPENRLCERQGMRGVPFGDLSMRVNFSFNKVKVFNTSLDPNF